jgi:hypothetical protein
VKELVFHLPKNIFGFELSMELFTSVQGRALRKFFAVPTYQLRGIPEGKVCVISELVAVVLVVKIHVLIWFMTLCSVVGKYQP